MKKYFFVWSLLTFCIFNFIACQKNDDLCQLNDPLIDVACSLEYNPVCGCDGKTYGNECSALIAGVPSTTPGECP